MEFDDLPRKPAGTPLDALEAEALDDLSRDELTTRIRRLEREIARTRETLEAKARHAAEIEQLFGNRKAED